MWGSPVAACRPAASIRCNLPTFRSASKCRPRAGSSPRGCPTQIQALPDRRDCQPAADCYNESKMIQTLFGSVEQEPTLLERLKSGVAKTRAGLVSRLEDTLAGPNEINPDLLG